MWEINGTELKNRLLFGFPNDYSITAPELFPEDGNDASGASDDTASRNYFSHDSVMRLNLSEVMDLLDEETISKGR